MLEIQRVRHILTRVVWLGAEAALIAAVCYGIANASPAQDHQPAHQGPLSTWARRITGLAGPGYYIEWLSNKTLLMFPASDDPFTQKPLEASVLDVETGKQTPLEGFNRQLKVLGIMRIVGLLLSPDHQWLCMFWAQQQVGGPVDWYAIRLDGTNTIIGEIRQIDSGPEIWSRRSDELLALNGFRNGSKTCELLRYRLAQPKVPTRVSLPYFGYTHPVSTTVAGSEAPPLLGQTPLGSVIAEDWVDGRTGSVRFFNIDIEQETHPIHTWEVSIPGGAVARGVVLSPQADRLAWIFYFEHPDKTRHLTPQLRATREIWVSRLDGSDMHLLGYEAVGSDSRETASVLLHWLPDGKHLSYYSFPDEKILYSISVD